MPSSRRGSWSAVAEDHSHLRSLVAAHPGTGIAPGAQRPSARLPPPPPSYHSPYGSPHHSNGRALPAPSSPHAAPYPAPLSSPARTREPGRVPLGGPLSPPPSLPLSPRVMSSPGSKLTRAPSPGLSKVALPKLAGFPIPESGNIAPIATTNMSGPGLPTPATLLPPLSASGPPRMANGSLAEKVAVLPAPLPTVPVPVDGS
ncbi:hypothetical protein C8Q80DRAFT_469912 [Daedaleopsis nitida]|nr:hypothetical protein C8Q80DRAFT_469912 [Daedaleopsis nitida]